MSSFNYSIFLCDCCQPSKSFRNLWALQQHEKASRPIQDVIVKEEPQNDLVEAPLVQTTAMPQIINNNNTLGGVWLLCSCCNPGQLFPDVSNLVLHINSRINGANTRIIYQDSGNVSYAVIQNTNGPMTEQIENTAIFPGATVGLETLTTGSGMPNALPQRNSENILASTILSPSTESLPNVALNITENTLIRPKPFSATTTESLVAESGSIIGQNQSENTFIRPEPVSATPIETVGLMTESMHNTGLHEGNDGTLKCVYCDYTSKTELELHQHIGDHWRGDMSRSCPLCGNLYMTVATLLRHHRECLLKTDLECLYCEETKKTLPELHEHIENHWKERENQNCPRCGNSFANVTNLLRHHMKNHSSDKSFKCISCEYSTKTERELHEHIEQHWKEGKDRVCPLCKKPFLNISSLLRHHRKCPRNIKTDGRKLKCIYCGVTCETEAELHQHIGDHWRDDEMCRCHICNTPFMNVADLFRHHGECNVKRSYNYRQDNKLKCVYCENTSKTRLELREHVEKHLREDSDLRCPFCKKLFTCISHLIRHHRESHLIQCPYCKESTEDERKMMEHLRCHEAFDSNYYCKKCKGAFNGGALLLEHVKSHVKDKYLCDLCERRYREKSELTLHIRDLHLGLTKYKCTACPKSYSSQDTLKTHIYMNHTDNIPVYSCSECGLQFKMKALYNDHILRHQGFTPYACDKCDRQFPSARQLKTHQKSHIKPSKCAYCPKTFKEAFRLREHERAHVNKPELVQCSFCEKTFTMRRLKIHEREVHLHRKKRAQCGICEKTFSSSDYLKKHYAAVHEDGGGYACSLCDKKFVCRRHVKTHMALHRPEKPFKCTECLYACRYGGNLTKHMKIHNKGKKSAKSKK